VTPDGRACGTLVEAAILKGMRTGIVVTTNITDATPAAFSAHAAHRAMQSMIAMQQIIDIAKLNKKNKWGIDLMFGGGKCFFLPNTDPNSCRNDTNDIYSIAKNVYGYNTVGTKQEMDNLKQLPVLGFFSNVELRYNIDRLPDDPQPTLAEMTAKALSLLQANSKDSGFFLLVEGSRIDHAGHSNDIAAQLREVQAYNEAIKVALDFAKIYGNTLVVSTADHETGGVTLGRCVDKECLYSYNADFVNGITASTEKIASEIMRQGATNVAVVMNSFGIPSLTPFEEDIIFRTNRTSSTQKNIMLGVDEVINRRAYIGFSTLGHTGVDVNVYAYGAEERIFRGNQENTDIGAKLAKLLRLDLEAITNLLNQ
jgi:alkaline phosphatase